MRVGHGGRSPSARWRGGAALAAAALVTLLSACGGAAGSNAAPSGPVEYDDNASVIAAGTLIGADLDPYKAGGQLQGVIDLYDTLIRPKADFTVVPGLATEWAWSPDNLKLTLTLRQGVTFSDGTPFDSSAVVGSLNRARSGESSQQKATLAPISDVAADGADKAVITVKQPYPALVSVLSSVAGMVINPKLVGDEDAIRNGTGGLGTGPYTIERFEASTQLVLKKRADYWDAAANPHSPQTFTYNNSAEGNARLNGLRTGQFQAIQSTGTPGLNGPGGLPQTNPEFKNTVIPAFSTTGIAFAFVKPFDNPLVRQAVAHAINFQALGPVLADQLNCGDTRPVQLPMQGQIGYNPDAKPLSYDVEEAKRLLAQAGYPNGQGLPPITMTASQATQDTVASQAFQAELGKVGFQVTINPQPSRVYQVAQMTAGNSQMATLNLTTGGGIDPSLGYNTAILANPQFVDDSAQGQEFKSLLARAATEPDDAVRTTLYSQAEEIAAQQAFYVPYCRFNNGFATTAKLGGFDGDYWLRYGAMKVSTVTVAK
jgi:peptide/nickel transport system substrate-binding protein